MTPEKARELLFPYDQVRAEQDKLLLAVEDCLAKKKNLICHAPTGLGKTIAVLGPAISHALSNKLHVLFLTSRYTQHRIALETINAIKAKYSIDIPAISIIGKKWMCSQPGVSGLFNSEFFEFCRKIREDGKCEFYMNLKRSSKLTVEAKLLLEKVEPMLPVSVERMMELCSERKICPYYFSIEMAAKSKVIIGDYYYLFHPKIQESFLAKTGIALEDSIVIIDEAHNLNDRLKDLASEFLSGSMTRRAIQEAKKAGFQDVIGMIADVQEALLALSHGLAGSRERMVRKEEFMRLASRNTDYDEIIGELENLGQSVRESQRQSYIGSIASFLSVWKQQDEGFARIISVKQGVREPVITLSYRCLDPSVVGKETLNNSYSSILISGTLQPTSMHRQVLGLENAEELVFNDPFPKGNRINLVIPKTSTKFTQRSEKQYKDIAAILAEVTNLVPGNSAVYFPSYDMLSCINRHLSVMATKTLFMESGEMSKTERIELLEAFKAYKDTGAVLLAVISGSFGEGIDLPGDLLKAVVVVGLPLSPPDMETKSLIDYYDRKYGKGWDYGYLFPAFNKCIQSAGRCIRSETDRGLIVFLDERYTWSNYSRCFPRDWDIKVSENYKALITEFFRKK